MAELIGVVASGIAVATLAAQVVDSVQKLKAFWDSWEEAPKDLRCLADDIETLSVIVAVIRDDHSQHGGSFLPIDETFIGKSICLCQNAANRLNLVVSELESEIKGRGGKWKRFVWIRLALKRDKMASFATALQSTKLTLILANQVYCQGIQDRNWRLQHSNMTQLKSAFRRPDSQEDQIEDNVYDNEEAPKDISIAIKISDQLILRLNSTASRQEMLSNHVDPRAPLPPSSIISQWIQYHENIIPDQYRMRKISETPVLVSYTSEKVISFSPPQWLLQRRYELRFSEAVRGFDHKLRTYNTIPSESLVFSHCINGNVPGLVEMFQAKTASPFDIDTNGNTLLHYTAQFVRLDACRFLIAQGVHGNVRHAANPGCSASKLSKAISKNRESPLHLLARSIGKLTSNGRQCFYEELGIEARNGPITTDEIRDLLRLLIDHGQCDPLSVDKYGYTVFSTYRGPTELFSWLRRQEALQINTGQPDDPGTAALFNVAGGSYSNAPYLARVLLPHGKIDKSIARYTRSDGYTILHALCWRSRDYWLAPFPFTSSRSTKSKKSFVPKMAADEGGKEAWFEMMSDAVRLEADVHACCRLWRELCTPLDYIIGGFSRYEPFDHSTARTAQTAVRHWLQLLEDSGKDLIEYGSEEVRLRAVNREIGHSWDRYPGWEIQSFNFGKHAMDFKIEWREPQVILETALSEFWRSIEAQDRMETVHVRPIPGTWID